ncbi:MAG: 6-phosphogluconolactonase [Actinobacteria bacterium]|nr:6-phosphogluconolactonase [Actinomycetota bacterium]
MADVEITVANDAVEAAHVVARRLAEQAREGGHVALTGGSSPRVAYELAAELEPAWNRVEVWWGDERCVPPDDSRSNYGMAKAALLDRLSALPSGIHRMQGELGAQAGADAYEREIAGLEAFDLMLLGMGPDGHIASLYPNQPTLDETERRAVGAEAHLEPYVDRITLTLPVLRRSREVLFIVTGEDKADAVRRAFAGEPSHDTPASLVRAELGPTHVVLDRGAAKSL